ncbi:hypothetical protein JTB14_003550 [Gonioctena quinquepunctata]|nr:hypothetical protein JTB14_003550 [Gonioctena quinquepunctata]
MTLQNYNLRKGKKPRRVRFTLPPPDGSAPSSRVAGVESAAKSTRPAGDEWFRTRASFSTFSSRSESTEKRPQRSHSRIVDDYATFLSKSTSVLVTSSPGVRIRIHPTGR